MYCERRINRCHPRFRGNDKQTMYNEIAANKRKSIFLMTFFIALILALGYLFDQTYGAGGYGGLVLAIFISLMMMAVSYFAGDKIALAVSGAKPIAKSDNPYLYRMVENLCLTAGLPLPKIYLMEDSAINAFATGRHPQKASVAVTRGAIEKLQNEELEGVIAHELSHVKNYDIRFMMLVAVLVGAIALLSNFFLRGRLFGFRHSNNDRQGGQLGAVLLIVGVILAILSPLIAELIKLAVSRRREFLADASGALLTRYPEGLARALEKIGAENQPLTRASPATAHLFFANPFSANKMKSWFSTHPPIEERIKILRQMA